MIKYSLSHLASAITWWLNYISAVGREYIIAESTLKIPATDYLEKIFSNKIISEYDHPNLKQKKIDLYYEDSVNNLEIAFELKFVREDSTIPIKERKRIFNDLMRLYLFQGVNKKGYFLICGNQFHFNSSFKNLNLKGKYPSTTLRTSPTGPTKSGYFGEWFSFDLTYPERKIKLMNTDPDYQMFYRGFKKEHAISYKNATKNKLRKPSSIKTKLIFLSEDLTASNIPQTFSIGIWEVS